MRVRPDSGRCVRFFRLRLRDGVGGGSGQDFQPRTAPMSVDDPVVRWLLQGDPAIRWQVLRDLLDAEETVVATERARVEHEGWGARLLALRAPDGLCKGPTEPAFRIPLRSQRTLHGLRLLVSHRRRGRRPRRTRRGRCRPTDRVPSRASRGPRRTGSCSTCATWARRRTVR